MNQNTTTRLDPLNNVMPYELLTVAHKLLARGQSEAQWAKAPVPARPLGKVHFEVARQVATFAVPLLMLVWAYMTYGLKGALLAVPAAWLTGFLLDKQLEADITVTTRREVKLDAGRYRAVTWLCAQMGLRPEEVTLAILRKMDKDYIIVTKLLADKLVKHEAAKRAAKAAREERDARRADRFGSDAAVAGAAAVVADTYFDGEDDDYEAAQVGSAGMLINPDSGLLMMPNTLMDIGGNAFGTDASDMYGDA